MLRTQRSADLPPQPPIFEVSGLQNATMAPSTLDLLVLTFNCAKNLVDAPAFAQHLQGAFRDNATGLPDLIAVYASLLLGPPHPICFESFECSVPGQVSVC